MITNQTYQMNTMAMPPVMYTQNPTLYQPVQQVVMTQQPMIVQQMPHMIQAPIMYSPPMTQMVYYRNNQQLFCPNCQSTVISNITYEPGTGTWIMCLGLGICLGPFGAVVFCIDDCKDCQHQCSKCGVPIRRIRFLLDE